MAHADRDRDREPDALDALIAPLRVAAGTRVRRLDADFDPAAHGGLSKKHDADRLTGEVAQLADLQARLAAEDTHSLLVVIQGLDASGKDGTVRHVFSGVNPQGVAVTSFKVPSLEELSHDFLWRYQCALPRRGQIGVFNRSHYEEVLVVRVHPENLDRQGLPEEDRGAELWRRRFRAINDWERHLVENGTTVVKLCLNLSREEQRQRLLRRCEKPDHNWKFSMSDVEERAYWDDYQRAFAEMLSATSTEHAPWYVIPADHKWFARLAVAAVVRSALERIDPQFPELSAAGRRQLAQARTALEAQAPDADS